MPARELVVTWAAILAATVLLAVLVYGLVAVLPGVVGAAGDAAGAVGSVGSSLADLVTDDDAGETEAGAANGSDTGADGERGADRGSDDGAGEDADDTEPSGDDGSVDGFSGDDAVDDGDAGDATTDAETNGSTVDDASTETEGTTVSDEPVEHETVNTTVVEEDLVEAINDARAEEFVSSLDTIYEEGLWAIAGDHAESMAEHGYVGTVAPDGETNADRFERYGPNCKRVDDYEDAVALAAGLNYSTRVDSEWHDDAPGVVDRVMDRWRDEPAVTDDTYGDMGVAVRHVNETDRLYAAAAIC